jgi:hypothetical protein
MGVILSVNLLQNYISIDQAEALAIILKEHPTLKSLCGNNGDETELDMSSKMSGGQESTSSMMIMLVAEIIDNGALSSLNLASNNLGKALWELQPGNKTHPGEFCNKKSGTYLKALPEGHHLGPMGAIIFADAIKDMGALSVLSLKDNELLTAEAGKILSEMVATNTVLKELDLSSNNFGPSYALKGDGPGFVQEFAVGIRDNGAMMVLNLANKQLGKLVLPEGWSEKPGNGSVNTHCSAYGYTHTDGREQKRAPEGAKQEGIVALANAIPDMRALMFLDISENSLCAAGAKALAEGLKGNQIMTELNISSNDIGKPGAIALADAIPDMGAMTSLNLASNDLGAEGAKIIAACLSKCT